MLEIASLCILAFIRVRIEHQQHLIRKATALGQFYSEYFDRRLQQHREYFYGGAQSEPSHLGKDLN